MTAERILLTIITIASLYLLAALLAGRRLRRASKEQTYKVDER